jgi:hypothetical protein
MDTIWEGRIAETFHGYKAGRVYELADGSRWKQEDATDEPVYREFPKARILYAKSVNRYYLDVDGTSATVHVCRVEKYGSRVERA